MASTLSTPMSKVSLSGTTTTTSSSTTTTVITTTTTTTGKSTVKRDSLRANELAVQAKWEELGAFETDVVAGDEGTVDSKFLVTFPFPYSNGNLHIGHAFSLTKAVFRAQFERHRGKNVLFPFAFHCTGMPIQAAANKLKFELNEFGCPPSFPEADAKIKAAMEAQQKAADAAKAATQAPDKKAKGGRTKLVAKTGRGLVRQWNILKLMVPEEEIPKFTDPHYWLNYFPPIGVRHMKRFGAGVDWRRAYITTDVNPYYDAFIQWQYRTLRKRNKILFGKRNNVYSLLDGQVCADHDRSVGENVGAQEYTLIKLKVVLRRDNLVQARHEKMLALLAAHPDSSVYLVPATLRPETMYGQTNCFVLPTGEYGAYYVDATRDIFVMSHRAARNLSCQVRNVNESPPVPWTNEFGVIRRLATFGGDELLGLPLSAPHAKYDVVYTLPLLTIKMDKGTGVVTSVPSDAPDDYVSLRMLQQKPDFCAKYGLDHAVMVAPYEVVPIIDVPGYGEACAVTVCEKLNIQSPNDANKLAQAKDETYLKGFTLGVLTVGPYRGHKVSDAKPKIRTEMIDHGQALPYFEPESKVVSRTNDECVVAATDQWYLVYGDDEWSQTVRDHITDPAAFNAYDPAALSKYDYTVGWLKEWACTRQFGLGTKLPWDKEWVIESLSDSTIYMAYYTIAHLLQGNDNLNGDQTNTGIDVQDLTDEVWDYIFLTPDPNTPPPTTTTTTNSAPSISTDTLRALRASFRYWYPMDLRVSAKDLIPNHLTMALYHHAAVWADEQPDMMPRGYYTNGHVMVDAQKMSKSEGNFLMMDDTVEEYSCDGTRFACADAGDSMDDANFSRETATKAILSLCNEETWILETVVTDQAAATTTTTTRSEENFMDRVLDNEVNRLVKMTEDCYENMQFREGLQRGWFEMLRARNEYRSWCEDSQVLMNKVKVRRWAEALVVLICPICPHWSEKMWTLLGKDGLAVKAPWPVTQDENKLLTREATFLRDSLKAFRVAVDKNSKKKKGAATAAADGKKSVTILVTDSYPDWKNGVLLWMHQQYDDSNAAFPSTFMKNLKDWANQSITDKKRIKLTMQFASWIKREVEDVGRMAMDIKMPFDQRDVFLGSQRYIAKQLKMDQVDVINLSNCTEEESKAVPPKMVENVTPGKPALWMR